VIGTVRSPSDEATAKNAGAHEVLVSDKELTARVRALAPGGIDHIVEVAFGANIEADVEFLKQGGSIASYATDNATPKIPFWQMVFKNIRVFFLGSDDFPKEAKLRAARDLNTSLARTSLQNTRCGADELWLCCEYQESLALSAHRRVSVHPLFNSRIWEQPHNQDEYIACARNGRPHEGNCQRERIQENGCQALPVSSDGLGDF
jgi:hypothetical protein